MDEILTETEPVTEIEAIEPVKKIRKKNGRPTVMTDSVVAKLEHAFAIDSTVEEACSYANIGRDAFYDYLKRNPEFNDRITDLRQVPVLKARHTVVASLGDPSSAKWYLEKKKKLEFGPTIEISGELVSKIISIDE